MIAFRIGVSIVQDQGLGQVGLRGCANKDMHCCGTEEATFKASVSRPSETTNSNWSREHAWTHSAKRESLL
jgi:hypothetical protein